MVETLDQNDMKRMAGEKAIEFVEDGMILGLGTGTTVECFLKKLSQRIQEGLDVKCIPSSNHTKKIAKDFNIPLTTFDENPEIDLTIDGADEVDSDLNVIKGGGGALTREKIVAFHSKKVIIIIDESKIVKALGVDFPVPVEVLKFGWTSTKKILEQFGCTVEFRKIMDETYITDNSNYILDCDFGKINNPEQLEQDLNAVPGVVENGLFINMVDEVIVGSKQGIMSLEKKVYSKV